MWISRRYSPKEGAAAKSDGEGTESGDGKQSDGEGKPDDSNQSDSTTGNEAVLEALGSLTRSVETLTGDVSTLKSQARSKSKGTDSDRTKALEKDGKFEELATELKTKTTTLESENTRLKRRNDLIIAASESDAKVSKAALMKLLPVFDEESGGEKSPKDLVKEAVAFLEKHVGAAAVSKDDDDDEGGDDSKKADTTAFGAKGGAGGNAATTHAQKIRYLVELGQRAAKTKKRTHMTEYQKYKHKLTEEKIPLPSNLSRLISGEDPISSLGIK
jgi:hypothetical protein